MNINQTINTQVTLPVNLYRKIARQAQINGNTINSEIVALLTPLLAPLSTELKLEFESWEEAIDEELLTMDELYHPEDDGQSPSYHS
jgi:hypothetical protein